MLVTGMRSTNSMQWIRAGLHDCPYGVVLVPPSGASPPRQRELVITVAQNALFFNNSKPMIAHRDFTKPKPPLLLLKITLEDITPPIWRRLQVPGNCNLSWLHAVFQLAMGWTNSHLHQFKIGDSFYSDPLFELNQYEDDPVIRDEKSVTLMELDLNPGETFLYEYDFGDDWRHQIKVEDILPHDAKQSKAARCLDGSRACPPEDCGSVVGYGDVIAAMNDQNHEDHEAIIEWLGGRFDPEYFESDRVNSVLTRLKWPHTTEERLADLINDRDGYQD